MRTQLSDHLCKAASRMSQTGDEPMTPAEISQAEMEMIEIRATLRAKKDAELRETLGPMAMTPSDRVMVKVAGTRKGFGHLLRSEP